MAILTEKEASLEWGLFTAKLYAEYTYSQIDGLWINLYIDGMPVRCIVTGKQIGRAHV